MSQNYTPTKWIDDKTVGTASVMNNMEKGIEDAHDRIDGVDEQIKDTAKKTSIEYGKLYLLNEDGTKIDEGTELPVFNNGTTDINTVKQDISDIKLQIGTEELTTTSKKIKGAINELDEQIKDITYKKFNIRDYGAKGDGVTDDSQSIRLCIDDLPDENFELIFPPGLYIQGDGTNPSYSISSDGDYTGDVNIGNPIHFSFENKRNFKIYGYGATIQSHKNNSCIANNRGFSFINCKNGIIEGLTYDGMKNERKPNGGDPVNYNNQSGFRTENSDNLEFRNCKALNCVMDGFTIRGNGDKDNPKGNNIKLINCLADNGYRQGLSVINSHHGILENCTFSNTGKNYGALPKSGVDLEQGYTNYTDRGQKEWIIRNCIFENNEGGGLLLHWGTYNSIVDRCTFKNGGLLVKDDSENLTVNNTITNCIFQNSDITLSGGGCYFKQNIAYNSNLSVATNLYSIGISRRNEIKDNLFKWEFNPANEELESNIIRKKRRVSLDSTDVVFDNNILINPTGTLIPYCISTAQSISNNTIISDIDCTNISSVIFGTIQANALKCSDNNILSDKYEGDFNPNTRLIKSNLIAVPYHKLKNSNNNRIDIQFKGLTTDDMNGNSYNVYLNYNGNRDLISRTTQNNQTITRVSGNKQGLYKVSNIYSKDNSATITMYPMTNNTDLYLTVELESNLGSISPKISIKTNVYTADNTESIVYNQTIQDRAIVTTLPTDCYLYKGLSLFYNNKMVYWSGSNATKWVDAMGNTIK